MTGLFFFFNIQGELKTGLTVVRLDPPGIIVQNPALVILIQSQPGNQIMRGKAARTTEVQVRRGACNDLGSHRWSDDDIDECL